MKTFTVVYDEGDDFPNDFTVEAETKEEAETECLLDSSDYRRIIRTVEAK